jgi:hypothetical protein
MSSFQNLIGTILYKSLPHRADFVKEVTWKKRREGSLRTEMCLNCHNSVAGMMKFVTQNE